MFSRSKKTIISLVIAVCLMSTAIFAAISLFLYDNAKLSISGIHIVINSESNTVQGLVDVSLKNLNATGVEFCLMYDKNYIELSKFEDNSIIDSTTAREGDNLDRSSSFFNQNTDAFPENSFQNSYLYLPGLGAVVNHPLSRANTSTGYLSMNFMPISDESDYIDYPENSSYLHIMADSDEGVTLGQISFRIKEPEIFSKLSRDKLDDMIKIVPFSKMYGTDDPIYGKAEYGSYITYYELGEDGLLYRNIDLDIAIDYEINIIADIANIVAQPDNFTVTSYEIYSKYGNGTEQDAYDFLNENSPILRQIDANGMEYPLPAFWSSENCTVTPAWNAKGGEYTVEMYYSDDFIVTATINVLPVTLTGFYVEKPNITYIKGAENFPVSVYDLELPTKVRPILDTVILNGGIPEIDVLSYYYDDGADGIEFEIGEDADLTSAAEFMDIFLATEQTTSYELDCNIDEFDYPWLTAGEVDMVKIARNVMVLADGEDPELPPEITATAETSDDGTLTISVAAVDGSDISTDTDFEVRMPGGDLIDPAADGVSYDKTYNPDGTVTITIKADISVADAEKLAKAINLGERLGEFSITAVKDIAVSGGTSITAKSTEVFFPSNPRKNLYIAPEEGSAFYSAEHPNTYVFDYSMSYSPMFPISSISDLSETIELLGSNHSVTTTYDGYDGGEPGALSTITVESWTVVESDSDTVTVEGVLKDGAVYTNYGEVANDNEVKVRIKYYTTADTNTDRILIEPTVGLYGPLQEGYDYDKLQTRTFKVTNIGATDIFGLTTVISVASIDGGSNTAEAFIETKTLPLILFKDGSAELDITTKFGLSAGIYTATATIYSNGGELGTITLTFEVTEEPVYEITFKIEDSDGNECEYGTAKTSNGATTAVVDREVTIIAEPKNEDDYKFVCWKTDSEYLNNYFAENYASDLDDDDNLTLRTATFPMPASDITLVAVFEETLGAKLQASELYVLPNEDLNNSKDNYLPLSDTDWNTVAFDPAKREYMLVVDNGVESVNLWFMLRDTEEAGDSEKSITNSVYDESDVLISRVDNPMVGSITDPTTDDYYKTNAFVLDLGPNKNVIELTLKYDDADEGEVTRTYKITVYRKISTSDMITFNYGNSPYGRIMRDGTLTDAEKIDKKEAFVDNGYKFISSDYVPNGSAANFTYTTDAWSGTNYDTDDYAIFFVNTLNNADEAYDAGYTKLRNSIGEDVTADGLTLRRVTLKVLSTVGNGNATDFSAYENKTIELSADGNLSELLKYRIRPDVYELEYIYEDYDGSNAKITKPLIVTYPLGDVNVSGTTDTDDAARIRERYRSGTDIAGGTAITGYASGAMLFRHRIVDANADKYVSMLDGNAIERIANNIETHIRYVNLSNTEV